MRLLNAILVPAAVLPGATARGFALARGGPHLRGGHVGGLYSGARKGVFAGALLCAPWFCYPSLRFLQLVSVLIAILIAIPASAQMYKWVDENGVTNYSGEPPSPSKAAKKFGIVEERISVYTPDSAIDRRLQAGASTNEGILSKRIDGLERQLEAERQARQYAAAAEARASQAAYDMCVGERRVDCDGNSGYYPYAPGVVFAPSKIRRPRFVPAVDVTGVTAGNVTAAIRAGGGSFNGTPGVTKGGAVTFQSFPATRMSRGFPSR